MAIERWRPFGTMERWHPFRQLSEMQAEMNRLFDTVFGSSAPVGSSDRFWAPICDMWETKDEVVVALDLPGINEKDVSVSITGDLLTVKGERRHQQETSEDGFHRLERAYGRFERAIQLPVPVEPDKVKATYRDGVLTVTLPKAEQVRAKEIKVEVL